MEDRRLVASQESSKCGVQDVACHSEHKGLSDVLPGEPQVHDCPRVVGELESTANRHRAERPQFFCGFQDLVVGPVPSIRGQFQRDGSVRCQRRELAKRF
jgi:hypothetical protein